MHLAYLWLTKAGIDTATKHAGVSRETTCEYYKYFRQLVTEGITLEDTVIGGEGVEVELDESKLGKSGDSNKVKGNTTEDIESRGCGSLEGWRGPPSDAHSSYLWKTDLRTHCSTSFHDTSSLGL